jgi:ArsR family transcriptional regulator
MKATTDSLIRQIRAFGDPQRMRLLALCRLAECSVSELTRVTGLSQPRVSQHLKQLVAEGLLERFRDGHFVYYRVPADGGSAGPRRRLLALLPDDEPEFSRDIAKLRELRSQDDSSTEPAADSDRLLHKALVDLTVSAPLGKLLDIGCGQGRLLKLLASRAHQVVGVDIDKEARRMARAELLLAGLPNCSLRQGDMYSLPFADGEFDTVILDDVLTGAEKPATAIREATRLLGEGGRLLFLASTVDEAPAQISENFARWAADAGLRISPPRQIPNNSPAWMLGVATL